jgi:hypothetical protein
MFKVYFSVNLTVKLDARIDKYFMIRIQSKICKVRIKEIDRTYLIYNSKRKTLNKRKIIA